MHQSDTAKSQSARITEKTLVISSSVLALALGTGIGATPAEATLIVTPVGTTLTPGESMNFGPHDEFLLETFANGSGGGFDGLSISGNTGTNSTNLVAKDNTLPFLRRFSPGEVVDGSAIFDTSGDDPFKDPGKRFYGLNIIPEELQASKVPSDPFGWVDVNLLNNGDLRLNEFAFEDDTSGAPIPAAVPEPGTLSLFAVGGAALLAARRRKKQKPAA